MIRNLRLAAMMLMLAPDEPKAKAPDGETFHGHLDKCARCRERPLGMCPVGNALLEWEAVAT